MVVVGERVPACVAVLDVIEGEGSLHRRSVIDTDAGPAISYEWLGPTDPLRPLRGRWVPFDA